MILDKQDSKKLTALAKSGHGKFLVEYLEKLKHSVADVRNPLHVAAELEKPVRLGICEKVDELLIEPLKVNRGDYKKPEDNWE